MGDKWLANIYAAMRKKSTTELLQIWEENDQEQWASYTFDVIRQVLTERNIDLLPEETPGMRPKAAIRMLEEAAVSSAEVRSVEPTPAHPPLPQQPASLQFSTATDTKSFTSEHHALDPDKSKMNDKVAQMNEEQSTEVNTTDFLVPVLPTFSGGTPRATISHTLARVILATEDAYAEQLLSAGNALREQKEHAERLLQLCRSVADHDLQIRTEEIQSEASQEEAFVAEHEEILSDADAHVRQLHSRFIPSDDSVKLDRTYPRTYLEGSTPEEVLPKISKEVQALVNLSDAAKKRRDENLVPVFVVLGSLGFLLFCGVFSPELSLSPRARVIVGLIALGVFPISPVVWYRRIMSSLQADVYGVLELCADGRKICHELNDKYAHERDQKLADVEQHHTQEVAQAERQYREAIDAAAKHYELIMTDLRDTLAPRIQTFMTAIDTLSAGVSGSSWTDRESGYAWEQWKPVEQADPALRIGVFRVDTPSIGRLFPKNTNFQIPAFIPILGGKGVLIQAGADRRTANAAVQSAMLRLLATIPPGKLKFVFIDPVELGQNVAAFMHLQDYDESLVTGKAWTEPQQIEKCLADITEHMETVIQKYLRQEYQTIEEYNEKAGEVAEPYRIVVVFDFPVNFTETAARRLVSIMRNGPRCGVYPFVVVDTSKPVPYGFSPDDLARFATVLSSPTAATDPQPGED